MSSSNIAPEPRNGSNIDPVPPANEPDLDRARKEIAERVKRKLDTPARFPSDPFGKVSNK